VDNPRALILDIRPVTGALPWGILLCSEQESLKEVNPVA
jgi:hypothetical protein